MYTHSLLLGALALISSTTAQTVKNCPGGGVCYQINVPAATAASGTGDIFFQITGPTSMSWIGLGQGGQMKGSNIFMIYSSAGGKTVTLTNRLGVGDSQPTAGATSQLTLLAGSGIAGNMMTANIKCANCQSWTGGTMSLKDAASKWIWASASGAPINSDSTTAALKIHNAEGALTIDLTKAAGGSSANPFAAAGAGGAAAGNGTAAGGGGATNSRVPCTMKNGSPGTKPADVTKRYIGSEQHKSSAGPLSPILGETSVSSGATISVASTGSEGAPQAGSTVGGDDGCVALETTSLSTSAFANVSPEFASGMIQAHGVLGVISFVILFPTGAMIIRLLHIRMTLWLHAGWMMTAYILAIATMGTGIWYSLYREKLGSTHAVLGLFVVSALVLQPFSGMLHHIIYKKTGGKSAATPLHVWWGRLVVSLGIINGGMGLELGHQSSGRKILYAAVSAILWVAWMGSALYAQHQSSRKQQNVQIMRVKEMGRNSDVEESRY